jgi:hypothetical protein
MIKIRDRRTADDDAFETIIGHDGKPARVLKPGRTARVSLQMRDSMRRDHPPIHDGRQPLSDADRQALRGCTPGFRTIDSQQIRERRQRARDAREIAEQEMCDAWKNPPKGLGRWHDDNGNGNGVGSQGFRGQQEGDQCVVRGAEFPDDFGSPGTLQRRGGQLVCVPIDSDNGDVFDARGRKKYVTRDPAGRLQSETTEEEEEATSDSAFALNQQLNDRELAYEDYARELAQKWRG